MNSPRRAMNWDFDRDLEEGTALAVDITGIKTEVIRIPQDKVPEWAVKVTLSVEDYGRMLRFSGGSMP